MLGCLAHRSARTCVQLETAGGAAAEVRPITHLTHLTSLILHPARALVSDGTILRSWSRPNLVRARDYRGVNHAVWRVFVQRYGGYPAICRFELDVYAPPAPTPPGT